MTWTLLLFTLSFGMNERLQACREQYRQGEFSRAAEGLSALLSSGQLTEMGEIVMARKYLGASYYILGEHGKAREEFREFLRLDPNAELSLVEFPPEIVGFFQEVKKEEEARGPTEAQEMGQAQTLSTAALPEGPLTPPSPQGGEGDRDREGLREEKGKQISLALALLPGGVGQLYQREGLKGYLLMGGEAALLTANLVSLFQRLSMRNSDGTYSDPRRAESLQNIQNISAIGLYAALAYGLGDSLWGYFRQSRVEQGAPSHSGNDLSPGGVGPGGFRWGLAPGPREAFHIWLVF